MKEVKLSSEIEKEIRRGFSKSEIYDSFKGKCDDETLRLLLASKPSLENRKRYKVAYWIISIIWGIFVALELLNIPDLIHSFDLKLLISTTVSIYLAIKIWKFDGNFFLPGIIWFVFTIYNVFALMEIPEYDPDYHLLQGITLGISFIFIIGIFLMSLIKKKVFGYYKWFTPQRNDKNEIIFEKLTVPGQAGKLAG